MLSDADYGAVICATIETECDGKLRYVECITLY